jgi:hypothetical protein
METNKTQCRNKSDAENKKERAAARFTPVFSAIFQTIADWMEKKIRSIRYGITPDSSLLLVPGSNTIRVTGMSFAFAGVPEYRYFGSYLAWNETADSTIGNFLKRRDLTTCSFFKRLKSVQQAWPGNDVFLLAKSVTRLF